MTERLLPTDPAVQRALGKKGRKRRQIVLPEEAVATREGHEFVFRIARELKSPNSWNGAHWTVKHRESQEWERLLTIAVFTGGQAQRFSDCAVFLLALKSQREAMTAEPQRLRVTIERHAPSERHFIRDDDNLAFTSKPVCDALKRLGYIHNDSQKWLDHPIPTQHVSADGQWWTIIRVEARQKTSGAGVGA